MGTRADFYLGRGENAEWIGSVAMDAYPDGIATAVLSAASEDGFTAALLRFIADRDDFTSPEDGWPWPWKDSCLTDYSYAYEDGAVWTSRFGGQWIRSIEGEPDRNLPKTATFPDMTERMAVAFDQRSGAIFVSS